MDTQKQLKTISLLLRMGLAFTFISVGILSLQEPSNWISFIPFWLNNILDVQILLKGFAVFQIIIGVWLIWGKYLFYSAIIATLILTAITLFTLDSFLITFRDVGLIFAAVSLIILSKK